MTTASTETLNLEQHELPRVRPELKAYSQVFDHQPYWVIKDPVTLRYFKFNREEYFVIEQLKNGVSLEELKEAHRAEFRTDALNNEDVSQFVRTLIDKGLISNQRSDRDEVLYQRERKRRHSKLKGQASNVMFFKIPIFDPDKVLTVLWKHLKFIWTWPFFIFYLLLMALSVAMVMDHWNVFAYSFSHRFFTIYNIPYLIASVWIIKAIHEFGHGLTCKNYGGEVHEMGWLFMVFMPFFYCNVTDSWIFPDKGRRLLVTAGGIMTELLFAAFATLIWYFTEPPSFLNTFCFNIILTCSFLAVMFNANPLLRYDGYYILMDLIEVPNLRQRASAYMQSLLVKALGGQPLQEEPYHRFRWIFPFYAGAALVYRWFIVFYILFRVYNMLDSIHLAWLGKLLAVFSVFTMLLLPVYKSWSGLAKNRAVLGLSSVRMILMLAALVVLVVVVLFIPFQQHITLNFILEPQQVQWIRADVDGELSWSSAVHEGARFEGDKGGLLAHLENPELDYELVEIEGQIARTRTDLNYYQSLGMVTNIAQLKDKLESLARDKVRLESLAAQKRITIPFDGELVSTREELREVKDRYVMRGMPLALFVNDEVMTAKVWVTEKTFARIFKDETDASHGAELILYAFADRPFKGQITELPNLRPEESMGEFGEKLALSNKVGGEVMTEYDQVTEMERPMEPVYEVTIVLDQDEMPVEARPYMSGRVRINCGESTLFQWGRDSLLRLIAPEIRL